MKIIMMLTILTLLLLAGQDTLAHEGKKHNSHKKERAVDSAQVSKIDSKDKISNTPQILKDDEETETEGSYVMNMAHEIFEHVHNKIVHFTVSLSLVAFLFTLINFKWKYFDDTIKILVILSAASAIFAVFTGLNQAGAFIGDPKEWVVEIHEKLGIASAVFLWIWSAFLLTKTIRKYAWIAGLIVFVLVSIAGFYGGIAAH